MHHHHLIRKCGNAANAAILEISAAQYVATFSGREWGLYNHIKAKMICYGVSIAYRVSAVRSIRYEDFEGISGAVSLAPR